jgi:hypothetical protein
MCFILPALMKNVLVLHIHPALIKSLVTGWCSGISRIHGARNDKYHSRFPKNESTDSTSLRISVRELLQSIRLSQIFPQFCHSKQQNQLGIFAAGFISLSYPYCKGIIHLIQTLTISSSKLDVHLKPQYYRRVEAIKRLKSFPFS